MFPLHALFPPVSCLLFLSPPPTATPAPVAPTTTLLRANAHKDSYAARAASTTPRHPPPAQPSPSGTLLVRNRLARPILRVTSPAAARLAVADSVRARDAINTSLAGPSTSWTPPLPLGVRGVGLTCSGNAVVFATFGLFASDLEPYSARIASAFLPESAGYAGASQDSAWFKAIITSVPTCVAPGQPLPTAQHLQAELDGNAHAFSWAAPPTWLGEPKDGSGSVLLAFRRMEDLDFVLERGVFMFGRPLRARRFHESTRPRPCSNCCSLEHSTRACTSQPPCAICAQPHLTSSHRCTQCSVVGEREREILDI
ncbi:hypothetical protein EXIGLDRAFT_692057 [Exidia glandulosa HHB12029]|uniref:Uncharacterized protein n=1 Tax=Exidia glandulosa HHB12029 TaxID=1314781 RepID=A0A166MN89_EXIGL|nr:hypothetical protein EXIGLDRAFT_692057 [Exidia glandulosa HHB12029]